MKGTGPNPSKLIFDENCPDPEELVVEEVEGKCPDPNELVVDENGPNEPVVDDVE